MMATRIDIDRITHELIRELGLKGVIKLIDQIVKALEGASNEWQSIRDYSSALNHKKGILESRRIALARGYGVVEEDWLLVTESCELFLHAKSPYVQESDDFVNTICKAKDMFKYNEGYAWFVAGKFGYGNNPIFPDSLVFDMRVAFLKLGINENEIESPRWTVNGKVKIILNASGEIDREKMNA